MSRNKGYEHWQLYIFPKIKKVDVESKIYDEVRKDLRKALGLKLQHTFNN